MTEKNLPLELFNRHVGEFELKNPLCIETEEDLLSNLRSPAPSAIVFLPKSKALIDMTLSLVSGMVVQNGMIVLAGTNDGGIGSAKKPFEKFIGPVERKIVGNHSALLVGKNKCLGAGKKIEDFLSYAASIYGGTSLEIADMPGVFSAGELDEGTKLLLDTIPYDRKKILDVGCGAGVIGAVYKTKNPSADVTMSDKSKLAVFATQKTLARNKLEATVVESDVFDSIEGTFDLILCNPPFHKGIETDYSFIEKFAKGVKKHLGAGGEVYVVANSFLPYKEVLRKNIRPTETLVDDKKFSVYRATAKS